VLKGDLAATPLSDVLTELAAQDATGCLHIDDDAGDEALVYFKNGLVYSAYVPGRRPQLGARLISSGALAPEAMAEALEAQATELQGWRLGELLVHLGYVERPVVEAFVLEQLREACFDLSRWTSGRYRFRKNEKTREDVGSHAVVGDLLAEVARRRSEWAVITDVVHGPSAIPVLSAGGLASGDMTLDQDQWALLCKVDGERTIAQLARDCGFTTFEAGQIVFSLVGAGLLDVEETFEEGEAYDLLPADPAVAEVADERSTLQRISSALFVPLVPGDEPADAEVGSEISRLLGASFEEPAEPFDEPAEEPAEAPAEAELAQDLRSELASLTAAMADLPSLSMPSSFEPEFPTLVEPEPVLVAEPEAEVEPVVEPEPVAVVEEALADDPFGDSLARVSEALNALLGDALPAVSLPEAPKEPEPSPEELAAAREEAERLERSRAAAAAELAEAHAMAEAARRERTGGLRIGRRSRVEAEKRAADEAARVAAEAEAARVEAERLAAEQAAADEAARVEAERVEAERAEAERAEAERAEAERLAAEQAAAEEAARVAAEQAERVEAERVAAEQAAADEAARAAAEEAERVEAERVAAEEAERQEAERAEAERADAERLAAEQAADDEAARAAAEEEAERVEAERVAAERVAADEAARAAAEEVARLAAEEAERQEAERVEAEEAARVEAEEEPVDTFEVASMLRDLSATDTVETIEEYVPDDAPPSFTAPDPEPAFSNGSRAGLSETAALLRELTSLGLDDEPSQPAPPARNAANAAASAKAAPKEQPKKRKGLFGRG
jgi:hypothetical protein